MKTPTYEFQGRHRVLTYTLKTPETLRVYYFPGGDKIEVPNVVEARVSRHGNHQLTTDDGTVVVIPWGWIALTFPLEARVTPKEVVDCDGPFFGRELSDTEKKIRLAQMTYGTFGDGVDYTTSPPTVIR